MWWFLKLIELFFTGPKALDTRVENEPDTLQYRKPDTCLK